MVMRPATLILMDGKNIHQQVSLTPKNTAMPKKIKAIHHGKFILADKETGIAPENITVKRVGKDLYVCLEGDTPDHPTVIIEDYFQQDAELIGMAQDGTYHSYISSEGDNSSASAATLEEGETSPLVLSADDQSNHNFFGLFSTLGIFGAAFAAIGIGALALSNSHSGKSKHSHNDAAPGQPIDTLPAPAQVASPKLSLVIDNQGSAQGEILKGTATDDTTPTFSGQGGTPGNTVIIYDNGKQIGETTVGKDGRWTFTPGTPLADGSHSVTLVEKAADGTISAPSTGFDFTVDTVAPAKPFITGIYDDTGDQTGWLKSGDSTDDFKPTFQGRAEAGSIVTIFDNGKKIGETQADANGNWSFTPAVELSEGQHSFTVRATDSAGNTSVPSETWDLTIDQSQSSTGPERNITNPIDNISDDKGPIDNGGSTADTTPTLNGKGKPDDTVIVIDNGTVIGETTVDENGNWTFKPKTDLGEGDHEINVIIEDKDGNQTTSSPPWTVIVDTTPPDAPVIGGAYDDVGPIQGPLTSGQATDDTRPTLNGQAEAGSVVTIYDNNQKLGEITANENGIWSFTPGADLSNGEHSLTATATDKAGNTSEPSTAWELTVDTTTPDQPTITGDNPTLGGVINDNGPVAIPVEKDGSTNDRTPTFTGNGTPGDTIILNDNGNELGSTTVGDDGKWTFTPAEPGLDVGDNNITVVVQDPIGNQSKPSDPWIVIVDTTPPNPPEIGGAYDDFGPVTGPLTSGQATDDTRPTLNGQAEGDARITVYDNDQVIGTTTANADGTWSFTPVNELAAGPHSFTAQAQDKAGNLSELSQPWNTNIVVSLPDAPVIEAVIDDVGLQKGELKNGDVTDDRRPEVRGHSEPGATVILYDRNVEIGSIQADSEGHWSITPQKDLNDGDYNFTAVVKDGAGNTSPESNSFEVIIYSGNGPTQIARTGQMGKDSGYDGSDFVTDNGAAGRLMYGTLNAELTAGQHLQVSTDGGRNWGEAIVKGTQWAALDENNHTVSWNIQTRVVDQSGNVGFVMQQAVTLDNTAPRASSAIHLDGTNLVVDFVSAGLVAGDRLSVVIDKGAHRFEHLLTADDITAGSVSVDVGTASTASVALIDMAGNVSNFINTSGLAPSVNINVNGDVSELYGQDRDNVFSVADVKVLDNVKVIEGNGGIDTLKLTGADQVLDLSGWKGHLSSVEVIDITGSGNNTLKLSLGDVLDQGYSGAFISDTNLQMAVKGDKGDVVMVSNLLPNGIDAGGWISEGSVTSAGIVYDVYSHELGAELLIQHDVTVQFS